PRIGAVREAIMPVFSGCEVCPGSALATLSTDTNDTFARNGRRMSPPEPGESHGQLAREDDIRFLTPVPAGGVISPPVARGYYSMEQEEAMAHETLQAVDRRAFLKLAGAATGAAVAGGFPGIVAAQKAPSFPKGTKLSILEWVSFVPASDVE